MKEGKSTLQIRQPKYSVSLEFWKSWGYERTNIPLLVEGGAPSLPGCSKRVKGTNSPSPAFFLLLLYFFQPPCWSFKKNHITHTHTTHTHLHHDVGGEQRTTYGICWLFSTMWSQGHLAGPYPGCSERNSKNYKVHNVMESYRLRYITLPLYNFNSVSLNLSFSPLSNRSNMFTLESTCKY